MWRPRLLILLTIIAGTAAACGSSGGSATSTTGSTASAAPPPVNVTTAGWKLPAPVSRTVALADGSDIVVLGGLTQGDVSTSAVHKIDPSTGAVVATGSLAHAVHDAAGGLIGSRAFVFAGGAASTVATVQAWTSGQAAVAGDLPTPRSDLAAATVGGTTYVMGGFDGTSMQATVLATQDGTTFRQDGSLAVPVRYPAVASDGHYIWVFGGVTGTSEGSTAYTDAIQRFDPATGRTTVVGHLPVPTGHATAVYLGNQILVIGGRSSAGPSSSVLRLDPASGQVSPAAQLPDPRSDAAAVVVGSTAYLLGGEVSGPTNPLTSVVQLSVGASR